MIDSIMRSSRSTRLAVIVPEFSAMLRRSTRRLWAFERLAAQSGGVTETRAHATLESWQNELLIAIGLSDAARYPSAPIIYLGLCGEFESGTWMHADPIRLEMSNDGMRARIARPWSQEEYAIVGELISDHLARVNLEYDVIGNRAFIRSSMALAFTALAPDKLQLTSLRDALPQGADAPALRRLMTELQMLLHEKLADSASNSIWLWGSGAMVKHESRELPTLFADDPYALGLYHAHAASERVQKLPRTFDEILQRILENTLGERIVLVIDGQEIETLERDWFAPILRALNKGVVDSIDLYLGGYRLMVNRSLLRRFFTRPRSIELPRVEPQ